MMRRGVKAGIVIETLIILVGLGFLIKASMIGADTYRLVHKAEPSNGVITGISNYGFTANVQIALGADRSVAFAQNGPLFNYQIGEEVPVFYDPVPPYHATMQNFSALWFDTYSRGLIGLILAMFGFRLRALRSI
jgi:hypothetical protein